MKLLKCSYEAGKKIYFNDSSDYEDSKESDSDDETENETCENVTGENEIRPECVMDAANPGSYVALCYIIDVGVAPVVILLKCFLQIFVSSSLIALFHYIFQRVLNLFK